MTSEKKTRKPSFYQQLLKLLEKAKKAKNFTASTNILKILVEISTEKKQMAGGYEWLIEHAEKMKKMSDEELDRSIRQNIKAYQNIDDQPDDEDEENEDPEDLEN